jgi:hypothetical protein
LAGTVETASVCVAPAGVLSGTGTLIAPELTVTEPGTGGGAEPATIKVPFIPATPPQTGPAGFNTTTGKVFTVKMALFEMFSVASGGHTPLNTQRYL